MSHLDNQPEDNKNILAAKAIVRGEAQACDKELVRLLAACLDDRSNWIAKAAEAADTLTDVVVKFQAYTEDQQAILAAASGVSKEIYQMLEPDDSAPSEYNNLDEATQEFKDYTVTPIIKLMEGGK